LNLNHHTQKELIELNIQDGKEYLIEYLNKDYFNGETTLERSKATALINDGVIVFVVTDPYGMEKYISEVKVII
jgi:hypothetical protein